MPISRAADNGYHVWFAVRCSTQSWKILGITVQQTQSDSGPLSSRVNHKSMNMYISIVSTAARQKKIPSPQGCCCWGGVYETVIIILWVLKAHAVDMSVKIRNPGGVLRVLPCLPHYQFTSTIWFRLFQAIFVEHEGFRYTFRTISSSWNKD